MLTWSIAGLRFSTAGPSRMDPKHIRAASLCCHFGFSKFEPMKSITCGRILFPQEFAKDGWIKKRTLFYLGKLLHKTFI